MPDHAPYPFSVKPVWVPVVNMWQRRENEAFSQANPSARISIHHSWSELQNPSITVQLNLSTSGGSPGSTAPVNISSQFLSSISSSINFHSSIFYKHKVGSGNMWQLVLCWGAWKSKKRFQPGASILKSVASRRLWRQTQAHSLSDVKSWKMTAFWTHFKAQNAECAQSRKHSVWNATDAHPPLETPRPRLALDCIEVPCSWAYKRVQATKVRLDQILLTKGIRWSLRYGHTWSWSWSTQTCPRARCAVSLCPMVQCARTTIVDKKDKRIASFPIVSQPTFRPQKYQRQKVWANFLNCLEYLTMSWLGTKKTARIWAQLRIMTCSISTLHQGPGHICKVLFRLQKTRNAFVRILQGFQHFQHCHCWRYHAGLLYIWLQAWTRGPCLWLLWVLWLLDTLKALPGCKEKHVYHKLMVLHVKVFKDV